MIDLESATLERLTVTLAVPIDPTAVPPDFQLTTGGRTSPDSGSWLAGQWSTSWTAENGHIVAASPLLGRTGADIELDEGTTYDLWCRPTVGDEQPVLWVDELLAR